MSLKVFKYEVALEGLTIMAVPTGAGFTSFRWQRENERPAVWALCAPENPMDTINRKILVVATGQDIIPFLEHHERVRYIGTTEDDHMLIWHAFEVLPS